MCAIRNHNNLNMAKATIKSKTGALITIEGTVAEVTHILSQFEVASSVHKAKETKRGHIKAQKEQGKRTGASDLVISLKEDGFFKKAKTLGEIALAVEEKGFMYPTTTLSGIVLGLVQKRLLGRKKVDGKWVYGN